MTDKIISIKNAKIIFRNFSGEEQKYNRKGDRNFCVVIDPDLARDLTADGWAVKYPKPREDGEARDPYLPVKVSFNAIPPKVILVSSKSKKQLNESDIDMLDWAEFSRIDLVIRPYNWEMNGRTGVKAYLKSGYFTIVEDEFAALYDDIPME